MSNFSLIWISSDDFDEDKNLVTNGCRQAWLTVVWVAILFSAPVAIDENVGVCHLSLSRSPVTSAHHALVVLLSLHARISPSSPSLLPALSSKQPTQSSGGAENNGLNSNRYVTNNHQTSQFTFRKQRIAKLSSVGPQPCASGCLKICWAFGLCACVCQIIFSYVVRQIRHLAGNGNSKWGIGIRILSIL